MRILARIYTAPAAVPIFGKKTQENVFHLCQRLSEALGGPPSSGPYFCPRACVVVIRRRLTHPHNATSPPSQTHRTPHTIQIPTAKSAPAAAAAASTTHRVSALFISNARKCVPIWGQRRAEAEAGAGDGERDEPVLWDYHGMYVCVAIFVWVWGFGGINTCFHTPTAL